MNTAESINEIAGFVATAAVAPLLVATSVYGFGSPWYRSWLGRTIFAQWASLLAIFAYVITRRVGGLYPGYEWWALALYSLLFLAFSAMAVIVIIERRAPARALIAQKERESMSATPTKATVPEIWYKTQRVLRTVLQVIISFAALWATIALVAPQVLNELAAVLPASWVAWLAGALAFVGVIAGVITRIMAIPGVNAWLTKIGLGSVPAKVLDAGTAGGAVAPNITTLSD